MSLDSNYYLSISCSLLISVIEATNSCNSGHATSCASISDIISVLFFHPDAMKYLPGDPKNLENDKLILSKGHAVPILYAVWSKLGQVPEKDLKTLRKVNSQLEGHPVPRLPFIDIATGSLGQGLSAGCGISYSLKYFEKRNNKVFVILGDGECAEGSIWEAVNFAWFYQLNNLIAIVDVNSLGQSSETMTGYDIDCFRSRFTAFGWDTICIDGHDFDSIISAVIKSKTASKPVSIIARTVKGKHMMDVENQPGWHGKTLGSNSSQVISYLNKISNEFVFQPNLTFSKENSANKTVSFPVALNPPIDVCPMATRQAFGLALASAYFIEEIIVLDCDTRNSTGTELFYQKCPERFIECYIAEQNMAGVALGLSTRGKIPFACCFGVFMSRCFDQIRLSAISEANIKFVGSHAGVSVGEDGPTHMALEDIALFRSLPESTVLYPSDLLSTFKAVEYAINQKGIVYIKTSRPVVNNLYENWQVFDTDFNVLTQSDDDLVCVVSAGITTHEAVKAASKLAAVGIRIRVVDLFCVKPINKEKLIKNIIECRKTVLTVEDHYLAGGIYEGVASSIGEVGARVHGLYVKELPRSGSWKELLSIYEIDAEAVERKVKEIVAKAFLRKF